MINVTDLATYLYCPRKLYLEYTIEVPPPLKDVMIIGSIKHNVIDKINRAEEKIITSITPKTNIHDIPRIYLKNYKEILNTTINKRQNQIELFKINKTELFISTWQYLLNEGQLRAHNVSEFILINKIYGEKLWNQITPKILTEQSIKSENLKLKGRIDKIEIHQDKNIPIEIKTGSPPKTGVWPGNKIQLTAYMMLTKEHFKKEVTEGYIYYIDHNEKRRISLNPFTEESVIKTRDKAIEIFESNKIPELIENKRKCIKCQFNETCYNPTDLKNLKSSYN